MGRRKVTADELSDAVMDALQEYGYAAGDSMKSAVKKAGDTVKKEIGAGAPVKTGKYAKSWRVKTMKETSQSLELVVHSPTRYMLAHLLEHGHAKRGGGRTRAFPHIAPAEAHGEEQLLKDVEEAMKG